MLGKEIVAVDGGHATTLNPRERERSKHRASASSEHIVGVAGGPRAVAVMVKGQASNVKKGKVVNGVIELDAASTMESSFTVAQVRSIN